MRFKRVYIEISNICNLHCSFCVPCTRPRCSMDEVRFRHVIREVAPYTQFVYFHVKGEPLMHPLLGTFLDICEENGLQVHLTTNGTLLYKQEEMLLNKSALRQVNFSLHSIPFHEGGDEPEFYNDLDLTGAETYVRSIVRFAKRAAREKKKYSVLRLWNLNGQREVDSQSQAVMRILEEEFPNVSGLAETMKDHRSLMLEKGIFLSWEEEFVWPSTKNPYVSDEGICQGTRGMIGILADGTVVPCCLDANGEAPLGNIFREPLKDILESDYFIRISRNFDQRHVTLPLCRHCSYRTRFDKAKREESEEIPGETEQFSENP